MIPNGVDILARDMERKSVLASIVGGNDTARLHRVRDDAVVVDAEAHALGSRPTGHRDSGSVASLPIKAHIAGGLERDLRGTRRARRIGSRDGGEWRIVHCDHLRRM